MNTPATLFEEDGWLSVQGHRRQWRLSEDGLIYERATSHSAAAPRRTHPYNPNAKLTARVAADYEPLCERMGETFSVPVATLIATLSNESGGDPDAERDEGWDISFGLGQVLTSTALFVGRVYGWPRSPEEHPWLMPMRSYKSDRSTKDRWRRFLCHPEVNVAFTAMVHDYLRRHRGTLGDPLLSYAGYNAGGVYVGDNRYGLHATASAVEAFVLFFNDYSASRASASSRRPSS